MINLEHAPHDPGCYLFKDDSGTIIYIGKAKDLKKRVSSYFNARDHDEKTTQLILHIKSVEFFATSTEIEALILENTLIKKHRPFYNIDLKDAQRYAYILVTDETFPRLLTAREKNQTGTYYGPFVSGEEREHVLKVLRNSFQLRTCSKLPKKECLRYHIGLCSAPCIGKITEMEYDKQVKNAEKYLKGSGVMLKEKLQEEMKKVSLLQWYEKAKIIRDQIYAIEGLEEKQKLEKEKSYDEDIINFVIQNENVYLIVFNIHRGVLTTKQEFSFALTHDFLEEFLVQFYSNHPVPKEIILPCTISDKSIVLFLQKLRKGNVHLVVPQKGDKKELLDLVKRNIEISFFKESEMINALRNELNLNTNPVVIECFDISNISGTNTVGSMVQFRNAAPDKSNYRRFKIKTVQGIDDFSSIHEIVKRRYYRLKMEGNGYPDLIVIDGGLGQLHAAQDALQSLEVKIPIISLAKKFEEVYMPGTSKPLRLKSDSKGLKLLIQIRNEAHRFAIQYHRLLRSKEMVE